MLKHRILLAAGVALTTSISTGGNGGAIANLDTLHANNPHVKLFADQRGYQLFDITAERRKTDIKVDQVERRGGKLSTLESYAVTPDRPALHRA